MNITKADIKKYQKLCFEKFGKEPDYQTAYEQLSKLVRQMEIVYQPLEESVTIESSDKPKA